MTVLRFIIPFVHFLSRKRGKESGDAEHAVVLEAEGPDQNVHELDALPGLVEDTESTDSSQHLRYRYMPLLSGIIIPFSILLEIPGLTEHWYNRTYENQVVEIKDNPPILDAGLALSMASAVLANFCLLARFMERRVKLMTLFCILFLTIHDIINIIAITVFGIEHRFDDGFTYGQAFWITVCSTIISVVTNITLAVDYVRTPDFGTYGSGLTRKQRSLIVFVMIFLIYIALCALVNAFVLNRPFLDAMYYTIVSVETIGFGDVTPQTTGARVWTCAFASGGIVLLGTAIGNISEAVFEALEYAYHIRIVNLRRHRREMQKLLKENSRKRGNDVFAGQHKSPATSNTTRSGDGGAQTLNPTVQMDDTGPSFDSSDFHSSLENEKNKQFVTKLTGVWVIFISFWLIGSLIFSKTEGFTYGTSMYYCFMTFSTIGFGDVTVQTQAGRAVFIFWALLGVGTMTILVSVIVDAFSSRYKSVTNLHSFEDAVKVYRRVRAAHVQQRRQERSPQSHSHDSQTKGRPQADHGENILNHHCLQDTQHCPETLPDKILGYARTLEERLRFFRSPKMGENNDNQADQPNTSMRVPPSLVQLLNDVADMRNLPERVRNEALHDNDARQALFMLSVEDALHDMIDAAERSLVTLRESNSVV